MEWWLALLLLLGVMVVLMLSGIPVAVSFLLVDLLGAFLFLGGKAGIVQLILNMMERP